MDQLARTETQVFQPLLNEFSGLAAPALPAALAPFSGHNQVDQLARTGVDLFTRSLTVPVDQRGRRGRSTKTKRDGTFKLTNLKGHRLGIALLRDLDEPPWLLKTNVAADTRDLELRLTTDSAPSASLRGRVLNTEGQALGSAMITTNCRALRWSKTHRVNPKDGTFRITRLPCGEVRVAVVAPDHPHLPLGRLVLGAKEDRQLGDLRMSAAVALTIRTTGKLGPNGALNARILNKNGSFAALCRLDGDRLKPIQKLRAGSYVLVISGKGVAPVRREFKLVDGADNTVDVKLAPGAPAKLEIRYPSSSAVAEHTYVSILNERKQEVVRRTLTRRLFQGRKHVLSTTLGMGAYVVRVRSGDGQVGQCELKVTGRAAAATIEVR